MKYSQKYEKNSKYSDTNLRIEEIKKKYDTPSRRMRMEMNRSKEYGSDKDKQLEAKSTIVNSSEVLKESFAINRTEVSPYEPI